MEKVLVDESVFPTEEVLESTLGDSFACLQELVKVPGNDYAQEWDFISKKSGWRLKVSKRGKALFYVIPYAGLFRVAFALRDSEKDAVMASTLSQEYKDLLGASKRYKEGWALRIDVADADVCKEVVKIVDVLMRERV